MLRLAMMGLVLAGCLAAPGAFAEEGSADAKQTNEQLIQLRKQVADIQFELKKLTNRRWEYQVFTQDRRKTRSFNEILNELNKEGWEFVTEIQNEGFMFKRPAKE